MNSAVNLICVSSALVAILSSLGCKSNESADQTFSGVLRIRVVDADTDQEVKSHLHVGFVYPSGSYANMEGARGLMVHNTNTPSDGAATIASYEYQPYVIPRSMFRSFEGMHVDHGSIEEVTIRLTPKMNPKKQHQE